LPVSAFGKTSKRLTEKLETVLSPAEVSMVQRQADSHEISKDLIAIQKSNKHLLKKL